MFANPGENFARSADIVLGAKSRYAPDIVQTLPALG
jgi:hypothetical protein